MGGFSQGLAGGDGGAEVGGAVGVPGEGLHAWAAGFAAALTGRGVGMVDDPILLAVEGFEEAVVPGSEDAGIRVFV